MRSLVIIHCPGASATRTRRPHPVHRTGPRPSPRPSAPRAAAADQTAPPVHSPADPGYRGAYVSSLPPADQRKVVATVAAALAVGTILNCTIVAPATLGRLPVWLADLQRGSWGIVGAVYCAAGVAHFTLRESFESMAREGAREGPSKRGDLVVPNCLPLPPDLYPLSTAFSQMPHKGAWGGLWQLPGTARFHVEWTGYAEILGGAGLLVGSAGAAVASLLGKPNALGPSDVPALDILQSLEPISAAALFALTCAVTPANLYVWSHNAPQPGPPPPTGATPEEAAAFVEANAVLPPAAHAFRLVLQIVLLSTFWGCATIPHH